MMIALSYIVIILGYIVPFIFILGIAYRIWNWVRHPIGFSWGLFPKPTKWVPTSVIWKVFTLPGLFKGDKQLWVAAVIFHIAMLTLMLGHIELFIDLEPFFHLLGTPQFIIDNSPWWTGAILLLAAGYFIFRRIFITKTREISAFTDHFWLWFLFILMGIGMYLSVFELVPHEETWTFTRNFITLKPTLPPQNPWWLMQALLGLIYIIYFVMGKPIHSIEQFFTQYILVADEKV